MTRSCAGLLALGAIAATSACSGGMSGAAPAAVVAASPAPAAHAGHPPDTLPAASRQASRQLAAGARGCGGDGAERQQACA